ncbi:MAG: DUF2155 domain-containing protein [Pseudomonadota bacterium]
MTFAPALTLAACEEAPEKVAVPLDQADSGDATEEASESATEDAQAAAELAQEATPMSERVAKLGLLNKRNNVAVDLELRPGETLEEGPVILTLAACERSAPWEMPQETGAFVQVDVLERGQSDHARVFSGWLFKESPSLNVVEHPIYDVWVKDCAMRFPGDEAAAS